MSEYCKFFFPQNKDQIKVNYIRKIVNDVKSMGVFGKNNKTEVYGNQDLGSIMGGGKKDEEIADIMKKISEGKATTHELFMAMDQAGDKSGSISKTEFKSLANKLGIQLTDHRVNEIFASIKKTSGGSGTDEELNEKEFEIGLKYLQQKNTFMALDILGISPAFLTIALITVAIILLLIFVFIFLGIEAFALGGTFGAIVNSVMPAGREKKLQNLF